MLSNFKHLVNVSSQVTRKCEFRTSIINKKLFNVLKCVLPLNRNQNFHTNTPRNKHSNILEFRKGQRDAAKKIFINEPFEEDLTKTRKEGYFPTVDLPKTLFNGIPFRHLPIVHIKVSRNNTIMSLSDDSGLTKLIRSCGIEGFKNSRKGTNVAAQATGTSFGMRAVKKGFKTVRVILQGLGPGRLSSIKGLQLGGLDVVSITDFTTDQTTLRPRKAKRL